MRDTPVAAPLAPRARRIVVASQAPAPVPISTSPTETTFRKGSQAGVAQRSPRNANGAPEAGAVLLNEPEAAVRPAAASAAGSAGIPPPFAAIASRFRAAPKAINLNH